MSLERPRLISPPVSPSGKHLFASTSIDGITDTTEESSNGQILNVESIEDNKNPPISTSTPINRTRLTKENLVRFFNDYKARGLKVGKQSDNRGSPKRKKSPSKSPNLLNCRNESPVTEQTASKDSSISTRNNDGNGNSSAEDRQYVTRSRKRSFSEGVEETPFKRNKSNNRSNGLVKDGDHFSDKASFLNHGTVQYVHDSSVNEIPQFEPSFQEVDQRVIERTLKKLSLNSSSSLKDDQGLDKIHSKEVIIVIGLKLTPEQYYDTKRRFFAEKARKTHLKGTFKKTDAQKACKIDVNKTSKLFEIFQACGLLDDKLYV